jgi:hypothetical protein
MLSDKLISSRINVMFHSLLLTLILSAGLSAQQIIHQIPSSVTAGSDAEIVFSLPGFGVDAVDEAAVLFRVDGEITFRRILARFNGNNFSATIPGNLISGSTLYYYIQVDTPGGGQLTSPANRASTEPYEVPIRVTSGEAVSLTGRISGIEYRILSPEPGSAMITNDALVAVSLFQGDQSAEPSLFRLFVNGSDVTSQARITPFLITYIPENLPLGRGDAELLLVEGDQTVSLVRWDFNVVDQSSRAARAIMGESVMAGDVELTARNQSLSGNNYDFVRGSANLRGQEGQFRYALHGLITSQESDRLQPQNRYNLMLSYSDYFRTDLGHVYPTTNPLLLAGRRMFGVNAQLGTPGGGVRAQFFAGQLNRKVKSLYQDINMVVTTQTSNRGLTYQDTSFVMGFKPGGSGTFQQDIIGGRLSFGSGRYFQLGINAQRVRDDVNSTEYYTSFDPSSMQSYASGLSASDRQYLTENPDRLNVAFGTPSPVDNFVAATDILVRLDNNRFTFSSDAAFGVLNRDISQGVFNSQRAADLGYDLSDNDLDLLDRLSTLIIINENVNALPFKIDGDETEIFVPQGIFAYQSRANLNYFNNNFGIQYRWIGPDFVSLANNGIRRDIAGFTITDRFRLMQNQVYVNLSYESLKDNLIGNLDATTKSNAYGTTVSWFPLERTLPRITLGVRMLDRNNGVDWFTRSGTTDRSAAIRNYQIGITGDPVTLPTPRWVRTYQTNAAVSKYIDGDSGNYDLNFNLNYTSSKDQRFLYGDFSSLSFMTGITASLFAIPLRAQLNFSYTVSEALGGLTEINLFGGNLNLQYELFDNKLTLTVETAVTSNVVDNVSLQVNDNGTPGNFFDDYYEPGTVVTNQETVSFIMNGRVSYRPFQAHQFSVAGSYTNVVTGTQALNFPNDHFMQVRYNYYFN